MSKALLVFTLLVFAIPAHAREKYESTINYMWDLRGGLFMPDIDSEFGGGASPYADIFGNKKKMTWRTELTRQVFRGFGSLGVGGDIGLFYNSGKALLEDGTKSGDSTSLIVIPIGVKVVYRFDWLQEEFSIPLTPYGKAGLVYNFWWITDGDGSIATWGEGSSGGKARGGTYGYEFALGLSLLLDFFDPESAGNLERETGINNSYIFVEWTWNRSDNFGADDALRLGGSTWMFGLGLEF